MYSFKNDYSEGAHPRIIDAIIRSNMEQEDGYGYDTHTQNAVSLLKGLIGNPDIDIHLIPGGTQTNLTAIGAFLRPHEACICAVSGHIAVHETGAIEYTGHKVITVDSSDGKIDAERIQRVLNMHPDEHSVRPRLVYISNPTELGTVYTKGELEELSAFCKANSLLLYADGARLGSAICAGSKDLSLSDMCRFTDAFFIGGTKNGALLGEALVIRNEHLKADFRYIIKQKGALLAKGRLLGIQFEELFRDNLFFDLASHANDMAAELVRGIDEIGCRFLVDSPTNQIFPILEKSVVESLMQSFNFSLWEDIDENHCAIRLVTSWATKKEAVVEFISELKKLCNS